ncbi:MAG: type II secretion system protein GspF, partial [Candidatus Saccharibacteria bacterium]|nr:type II secretion system protein GspF [Pseudorhodobacter sp.]
MTAFAYRAVDGSGKAFSGVVEAVSAAAARADLRGRGLLPVEITAAQTASQPFRAALPLQALVLVTRQMATLLQSGLRIEDALAVIAQGQPARVAGLMMAVRTSVLEG